MTERVLQLAFFPIAATIGLTFVLSFVSAWTTGYTYGQEIAQEGFLSLARALAAILGAGILAAAVVTQSLKMRREQIERKLLHWLDRPGKPMLDQWNPQVELALEDTAAMTSVGSQGVWIRQNLEARRRIGRLNRYAARLFFLPIAALTTIVAVSLWAIPASEMFLRISFPTLNTTFVLLTSYGTVAALGSLVAAILLVLKVDHYYGGDFDRTVSRLGVRRGVSQDTAISDLTEREVEYLVRDARLTPVAVYFCTVVVAEAIGIFGGEIFGLYSSMLIHGVLMFTLLIHASVVSTTDRTLSRFFAAFALVPLTRMLSLWLPLTPFNIIQWLLIISMPLVAAGIMMMVVLDVRLEDVYLRLGGGRNALVQGGVALSGLGLGVAEFFILMPGEPWIPVLTPREILPASVIIIVSALAEELIFRGILLPRSIEVLGRLSGLILVSILFAAMHLGFQSGYDLVFVFAVGMYFGYVAMRTRSLHGAILAHGLANVALYLVMPFYF